MAQKHLHELLQEDQEPFQLKNYIADRRCQIKNTQQIQLKKRKPVQANPSGFPTNFCKNACFFSFNNSPDIRKSPLFEFTSPAKSPCRSPNAIFLHVPARTTALLLEAAMRIHKNSAASAKHKSKNKHSGLFGSILKKLKQKSKTNKREIQGSNGGKASVKDILKWDSFVARKSFGHKAEDLQMKRDKSFAKSIINSCEACNSRPSSAVWSESNEETKSFDMESSSSDSHSHDFACFESEFRESPFRFVLQRSPSPGRRTPEFSSPAASPRPHHKKQEKENFEDMTNLQGGNEEEEEKEQFSPVSVLEPIFQDDEDRQDGDYEDDYEGYDSYELVQRAKQQLLQKLHRFEKLAELDPIELEKRMLEQEYGDYDDDEVNYPEDEEEYSHEDSYLSEQIQNGDMFVTEVFRKTSLFKQSHIPRDVKRLISDLIAEEGLDESCNVDREATVKRVCQRLELWKEVEFNTIDMMVEQDLKREHDWKSHRDQVGEAALEVELAIFGLLVEELSEELMH